MGPDPITETATVVITDTLDENVGFVSAEDGTEGVTTSIATPAVGETGTVIWTLEVEAGKGGTVQLTVKVLEGASVENEGPGKVVNGGETTTVKVGNDEAVSVNTVENPVFDPTPDGDKKKPVEVSIDKINATTGKSLSGAVLQLQDADGKVINEWTSNGNVKTIKNLTPDVSYKIHEKTVPKGYKADADGDVVFTVAEDGTVKITSKAGSLKGNVVQVENTPDTEGDIDGNKGSSTSTNGSSGGSGSSSGSSGGGSSVTGGGGSNPKTGDDTPITFWILLMLAALAVSGGTIYTKKRRKEDAE